MTPPPVTPPQTSDEIRQAFVDYFVERRGHTFVPSSPVVPLHDPTLLFTNAGMNQFKPCFLEQVEPGSPLEGLKRASNSQKCIRAGGKHNDLEDVGKDTYHHTFFEMLGNWSIGDYFKVEAIDWAWEFLTGVCGLDGDRLYATYFEGAPDQGVEPDSEARDLWLRYLPEDHVLPGNMKDNFWEMGETGPCGPCSEIHYDRIGGRNARELVNQDDPDVLEVWNLVFIQFNREGPTTLKPLPNKHVDTGMGLERLVSVLQDVRSNYDTDIFDYIFEAVRQETGARAYAGRLGDADEGRVDMAYRVIADHIRTLCVSIADGAVPSNEGRGYVLRRVLRRAVRFGRQMLGAQTGFLSRVAPAVSDKLGPAFPELTQRKDEIVRVLLDEEESFGRTLDKGIKHFEDLAGGDGRVVSGEHAFQLYDTFGFPLDLTQLMAEERGMSVDVDGYERAMAEQKERSRAGSKFGTGADEMVLKPDELARLAAMGAPMTDEHPKYEDKPIRARVAAIYDGADFDEHLDTTKPRFGVVLDASPFYAEAGGQSADTGTLRGEQGEFVVEDVRHYGGYVLHVGRCKQGEIRVGETVEAGVDGDRRSGNRLHHTATHLMNLGLREVLGDHIDQKGSLVAPDRLRFDFSHNKPMTSEELAGVERVVGDAIGGSLVVDTAYAPLETARKIKTLRAVFGEQYPDPVRVVSVGATVADLLADPEAERFDALSVEFCGGTHASNAADIGEFCIVSETGVAKGVRRVEALAGTPARAAKVAAEQIARRIEGAGSLEDEALEAEVKAIQHELDALTIGVQDRHRLGQGIAAHQERLKALAKKRAAAAREAAVEQAKQIASQAKTEGAGFVACRVPAGDDRHALQAAAAAIADALPDAPVLVASCSDDRVALLAMSPKSAQGSLRAGDWIKQVAPVVGGKGGGKPDQAQGGGTEPGKIEEAIEAARAFAQSKLAGSAS